MIKNKDIIFIINPNSGNRKAENRVKELLSIDANLDYVITENTDALANFFNNSAHKYKLFIAVGGDGTVNEVIKYLAGQAEKILAVIPAGSGNGFSRELGFKKSVTSLLKDAYLGNTSEIDVLQINGENCINVSGLGLDSQVAHQVQSSEKRGFASYIGETLKSLRLFKPFSAKLIVNGETIEDEFQLISIANTRQFGNNAIIAPNAKPNDGHFVVCAIKPMPQFLYPIVLTQLFSGKLKQSKYIHYYKTKTPVTIQSDFKKYHVDGEPKTFENQLEIKLSEQKITVLKTSYSNH